MPRNVFQNAFLSTLAGPTSLYEGPPAYEVYIPRTTVAQTFAQVGLSLTTAVGLERHDRRPTPEAAGPNTP
jgi:hypothetical protein